jgi:hypothetical protein
MSICQPANAVFDINNNTNIPYTMTTTGQPAGTTVSFSVNPIPANSTATMTIGNTGAPIFGTYIITVIATNGANISNQNVSLILQANIPNPPNLGSPNGATNLINPLLNWDPTDADTYDVEVSPDFFFGNIVASATGLPNTQNQYQTAGLEPLTTYYWRVYSVSACGRNGSQSSSFTTASNCASYTDNRAYVNISATGANNGTSWADAFTSLESALQLARTCGVMEVWVAAGTYKPSALPLGATSVSPAFTNKDLTFQLVDGVAVYGGFAGGETLLSQRNWITNPTILSGDLNGDDGPNFTNIGENCNHVVICVNSPNNPILDGFTIKAGNATNGALLNFGSAIVFRASGGGLTNSNSTLALNNILFDKNKCSSTGGGMHIESGTVTLTNIVFSGNNAAAPSTLCSGGGLNNNGTANLTNVIFSNNSSVGSGGAVQTGGTGGANATFINVVFSGNSTTQVNGSAGYGGAVVNNGRPSNFINCTFYGNSANTQGGAMFNINDANVQIKNCIFRSNSAATSADIHNFGAGDITTITTSLFGSDPLFFNAAHPDGADNTWITADDGLQLQSGSPAVNTGTAAGAPATDILGNGRIGNTDMGAYELLQIPTITASGTTGTIVACVGTPSADPDIQQFTVSGSNLQANMTINAPANFEISTNAASGYGSSLTLTQTAGSVPATIIYVRSAASAPAGSISGDVTVVNTPVTSVAVSGTINAIPATPTITPGGPTTFCTPGSVTLTSSSASGNQWYLNGNPIGGEVNQTYIATASGDYTVVVTTSGCSSAPSAPVTVTANICISVNDVTLNEGNSGPTTFTFTVSLSSPAGPGGVTFNIATADGTAQDDDPATEDNDYVAKSLSGQITEGNSNYTFDVTVNGEFTVEPNETFTVNVTSVTGATLTDGQGLGTITNDDVLILVIATQTVVTSNNNPSCLGDEVIFTATVSSIAPNTPPGTVTFKINGALQPPVALNSSGQATYTTSLLPVTTHFIAADYSGSTGFQPSSGSLIQTVNAPPGISAPTVTQPNCTTSTGTIVVNATGSGALEYSINNGSTWSTDNAFSGLIPGSYYIVVRLASTPGCLTNYSSNPVNLNAATLCASIGDRVWNDADGDGVQDAGETGLNGVTVELLNSSNAVIATTVTAGNGIYGFSSLNAGSYSVRVVSSTLPSGFVQTYDLDGTGTPHIATFTLTAGQTRTDVDFGYKQPAVDYTIFPPVTPNPNPNLGNDNNRAIEVGVKFRVSQAGFIKGIRFYKKSGNNGTHTGHLWTSGGSLLATVVFTSETVSGWQQALFSSPVAVSPNVTYVASYFSSLGFYNVNRPYFTSDVVNGPIRALADGFDGPNGVFKYSTVPAFPNSGNQKSNFWVDVVFTTNIVVDNTPPTVLSVTPPNGATNVPITTTVTATFSEDMNAATIGTSTFELRNPSNVVIGATVTYNAGTKTATLTPSSPLANSTVYSARVKGGGSGVKDVANNATVSDFTWSFNTAADGTAPTIVSYSPLHAATGVSINTNVTATFSEAMNAATITTSIFELRNPSSVLIGATVTYNAGTKTATLTPSSPLANSTTYTAKVKGGAPGVKDAANNAMVSDYQWSFTTASSAPVIFTIFPPTAVDPNLGNDGQAIEVGVKFKVTQAGNIMGIRFYKKAGNTGTHIGHLWSSTGTMLAQATFTGETASGWQQVLFSSPVAITTGITYVASYFSSLGYYNVTRPYFTSAVVNGPLRALANGENGSNGVFRFSPTSAFPTSGNNASNFWVDVVFTTGPAPKLITQQTSLPANEAQKLSVKVTPNPSESFFRLIAMSDDDKTPIKVRITDISGRVLEQHEKVNAGSLLQVGQSWRGGTYFAEVIQGDQRKVVKIIKVN